MADDFIADDNIREIAEVYALDAVDDSLRNMGVTLDWSERSVAWVEWILDTLHKDARTQKPPPEKVEAVAKEFGSYIGEVFIRHHGGSWGMISLAGQTLPGIRAARDGHLFWPWVRTLKRLREGPEENVWHYYLHLTGQL
jgi:hypothetical protein